MKTIISTLFAVALFSFAGINAQDKIVYKNISQTEAELKKECISVDAETKAPIRRSVSIFTKDGLLTQKTLYKWIENKGWEQTLQYNYNYIGSNLISVDYHKWNNEEQVWHNIDQMKYLDNNLLLAEKL